MKKVFVVLLLLAGCASAARHDYKPAIDAAHAHVDGVVTRGGLPGAAAAVTVGDRMVWHETFGHADLAEKTPVTIHTRFRIGSVTKMITVAALMRLVEQGRLQLDDPAADYLPGFPHREVTLRQLAGHLGGVRHYGPGEFLNRKRYTSATESLTRIANDPLLFTPGERYTYTTYGYNVLAAVIESVSRKTFDVAAQSLVFAPAGMTESGFVNDAQTTRFYEVKPASAGSSGASGSSVPRASSSSPRNSEEPEDLRGTATLAPDVDLSDRLGGGAMLSTARDLARFLIAMSDARFLSDASRSVMFAPQKMADGKATNVGIGWRSAVDAEGRTFIHHGGQSTGGRAFVLLYPQERVGVAFVSNAGGAPFDEKDAVAIAAGFLPGKPPALK
jgi:CubicO group peptidase (beta-lactamase class C family)